jgi:hypothetical protein
MEGMAAYTEAAISVMHAPVKLNVAVISQLMVETA